jgi:hypothetical protein
MTHIGLAEHSGINRTGACRLRVGDKRKTAETLMDVGEEDVGGEDRMADNLSWTAQVADGGPP